MKDNSKKIINVLHLSTHDEECGIGKYQEAYLKYMDEYSDLHNVFYKSSLNYLKRLHGHALKKELSDFKSTLKGFDILHIQHEFGLYAGDGEGLGQFVDIGKALNKKIIITVHTAPGLIYLDSKLYGFTPKNLASYINRKIKNRKIKSKRFVPFTKADLVIVLNKFTKEQMINLVGVNPSKIKQTMIPVSEQSNEPTNNIIRNMIDAKDDDKILCTVGFISPHKGVDHALQALKLLPDSYKLAIIGGINPDSGNPAVYDAICELVLKLDLQKRVHITGYIKDDNELSELIRGCDIALYPYDPIYYRLASSAAINMAITNNLPIIAYPTESFKEINAFSEDALVLTKSPNYFELAKEVKNINIKNQISNLKKYAKNNSFSASAKDMFETYKSILEL